MTLLKDISPLHAEILEGRYDEDLSSLVQALNHRAKIVARNSGLRPGAIVRITDDPSAGSFLAGREARIKKVNQKSISITLTDPDVPDYKREWRVGPGLIVKPERSEMDGLR
jgi:hypothetical protein